MSAQALAGSARSFRSRKDRPPGLWLWAHDYNPINTLCWREADWRNEANAKRKEGSCVKDQGYGRGAARNWRGSRLDAFVPVQLPEPRPQAEPEWALQALRPPDLRLPHGAPPPARRGVGQVLPCQVTAPV